MLVEQALFTSAQTRQARGYHLVARSPGVTDRMAQTISVWGPTHDSLLGDSVDFHSLNYFAVEEDWGVLSRTVYGQSEYSSRGGFRVETNLIVIHREQLSGYEHNPLALGRMLLALGHLRLRNTPPGTLQPIELPCSSVCCEQTKRGEDSHQALTDEILDKMRDRRVAVIGAPNPLSVVASVLNRLPKRSRAGLSFTTGLKPSLHRRFDLHFLPAAEKRSRRELEASAIVCIEAQTS